MIERTLNKALGGIFFMVSLLPLRVLYVFSDFTFFLIYYIVGYRKNVVIDNISGSFPGKNKKEIQAISKRFYKHFSDNIFESIKLLSIDEESLRKRYNIENTELINKYFDEKKNVIMYMGHYGNWEWNAILPLLINYKVLTFYQPLSNGKFDELTKKARERFGIVASESQKGFKTMLGFWNQGVQTFTLMVGDQSPHIGRDRHWVKFLNHDTAFLTGTDRIAHKYEHVIVFPFIRKIKRGHYHINMVVLQENSIEIPPGKIIEDFAHQLENSIYNDPALWLWSHRRWKLNREELGE
jgi:KDO2-lipid IV(A) lauroyltransferase